MATRNPSSLAALALAAPPLSWPELHKAFGQHAVEVRRSRSAVQLANWAFFDFCLDQSDFEASGVFAFLDSVGYLFPFEPATGPDMAHRYRWEDALRQHYLLAAADGQPAWNRLQLSYQLGPLHTVTLHEATTWWDEDLATRHRQQQAGLLLPPASQRPAARQAQLTWHASQRRRLEADLVAVLLPANTTAGLLDQQLNATTYPTLCSFARTAQYEGEPERRLEPLPLPLVWPMWCYLRLSLTPHLSSLNLTLSAAGRCVFLLGGQQHTGQVQADGRYVPAPLPVPPAAAPPSPGLLRDLQALYEALAQALEQARADDDSVVLFSWFVKPDNLPEITCIGDEERSYPDAEEILAAALQTQLTHFAEESAAARAPWTRLYVLLPLGESQPQRGFFTAEQLPPPQQAADMLPCYAQIRAGLLPQLPSAWRTLTVAAGWGDGLTPYQASAQLDSDALVTVLVEESALSLLAFDFLYTYGLHAAGCDWQHVELTFQRTGELMAAFYYVDSTTHTGVADEPAATVEEWLPTVT